MDDGLLFVLLALNVVIMLLNSIHTLLVWRLLNQHLVLPVRAQPVDLDGRRRWVGQNKRQALIVVVGSSVLQVITLIAEASTLGFLIGLAAAYLLRLQVRTAGRMNVALERLSGVGAEPSIRHSTGGITQ